ncbi:ArgS-related anticodon-binding protein NrtL [Streptomyces sp. NPDC091377]|uniref:ArgS-related anticodon-binding protein NrtL n=1 Tax=Streptomyces sp. NPDC091377 TaxID=3365995 RepID=UPI003817D023
MTPVELSRTVLRAVRSAVDQGQLKVSVPERAVVTAPGPGGCGDYATTIALQLARPAGQPPLRVAEILSGHLLRADGVQDVVVTGPGFINLRLVPQVSASASAALVSDVLRQGSRYGYVDRLTGPRPSLRLHAAREVRALVVMDCLARILRSQGVLVTVGSEGSVGTDGSVSSGASGRGTGPQPGPVRLQPVPAPHDPSSLGQDAARWALLHPAPHDRPRLGGEHLVQRESNPLFRVRYAHARTRALSRNAADLGFHAEPGDIHPRIDANGDTDLTDLVGHLAAHPRVLATAARHHDPSRLARHLVAVADALTPVLPTVLPRGAEKPSAAHRARLALVEAAGAVLAGGLSLLGIDAPDHL